MRIYPAITSMFAFGAVVWALGSSTEDAARRGKDLFARRCSGCHAADINKEGPRLRGVYGRKAAGVVEFGYSESLTKLNVRWNDETLDRWLADPNAMAPETDMEFRLSSPDERKAVIAYLRSVEMR